MGLIRSGGVVIVSVLLFFALFFSGLFLTLNLSLNYDNVQSHVGPFLKNVTGEVYTLNDTMVNELINKTYYQDYNCTMIDCVKNNQVTYLYSSSAKDFWSAKFKLFIFISVLLFVLLFLLVSKKSSAFLTAGAITILSSLPYNKIGWIYKLIPAGNFKELISMFFSNSHEVFVLFLLIGIGILIVGVILTFLRVGLSLNKFFDKFKKKEDGGDKPEENIDKTEEENKEDEGKDDEKKYSANEVKKIVKNEVKKLNKIKISKSKNKN